MKGMMQKIYRENIPTMSCVRSLKATGFVRFGQGIEGMSKLV